MQVKLFRAAGMPQAIAEIRSELGPDALILSSRRIPGGIEVTAASETEAKPKAPVPLGPESRVDREALFAYHGVPAPLVSCLMAGPLPLALAATLRFTALGLEQGSAPLLVVGPPGAGKTMTVARLAARLVAGGVTPLVISADRARAGGVEQLAAFTRLLGVSLAVASHPASLGRALARRVEGAPVLIDAPGCDAVDPAQSDEMEAIAAATGAAMLVVLPGGIDAGEAGEIATAFTGIGAGMLVANRLDVSRRLGGLLTAAACGLDLVEAGVGPGAADGLVKLTPDLLAQHLLARRPARKTETHP